MAQNTWNARMPWPSPLLYQQSAAAPTHYHLHNSQNFEGTNLCPRFHRLNTLLVKWRQYSYATNTAVRTSKRFRW